jgi:hypothetical protein
VVATPPVTDEDVVAVDGGAGGEASAAEGGTPMVGSAAHAAITGSMMGGPRASFGIGTTTSRGVLVTMNLLGAPPIVGTLFSAADFGSAKASGFNVDPVFGMPVVTALSDPIASQFANPASPAVSPFAMATIPAIHAGQSGFGLSPAAVVTSFTTPAMGFTASGQPVGLTGLDAHGNVVAAGALMGVAPTGSTRLRRADGRPGCHDELGRSGRGRARHR